MAAPFVVRKTYASFLQAGTFLTDDQEVPVGDRNPKVDVLGGPPTEAVAVRFYDCVEAEVQDPLTGRSIICSSGSLDVQSGWTYYSGRLYSRADVVADKTSLPSMTKTMAITTLDRVGTGHLIICSDGSPRPYFPGVDSLLHASDIQTDSG